VTSGHRPLPELSAALARGELSSADLVEDALARVDAWNRRLNVFLHVDAAGARAAAAASDTRRARGCLRGPLDGIPYALKDNIVARGMPATCGSRFLAGFVPPYDATVVERLRRAGAVLIGKANMDEFAMGSSNEHSAFGPTRNPHDPERVPGGSSGGACAAVAAGMIPLAFGSSTGGSVRLPASFCGVVGAKPSYGRVSRYGLVAFGSSLDQIGPIARSVEGAARALQVVAGEDPRDATTCRAPVPDWVAALDEGIAGLRIGVVREHLGEGIDPVVRDRVEEAIRVLEREGARVVEVEMPHTRFAVAAYHVVSGAEASSNLARFDGARYGRRADRVADLEELYVRSRADGFGDEVKRRILIGTFALSAGYHDEYYGRAMKARSLVRRDYEKAFARADALVSPAAPVLPFRLGERLDDPLAMYLVDALTIPANLAGVPALSVPARPTGDGLPVGLQIQAPVLEEARMLRVAHAWERVAGLGALPRLVPGEAA
jgi:aspartyl-tRNA(Asn)/glutamyl-tRNA(Gln) amidotransferase subunit A